MPTNDVKSGLQFSKLAILLFGALASFAAAAETPDPGKPPQIHWLDEHLLSLGSEPPFSFVYGRQVSDALLKTWPRKDLPLRELDLAANYEVTDLDEGRDDHGFRKKLDGINVSPHHSRVIFSLWLIDRRHQPLSRVTSYVSRRPPLGLHLVWIDMAPYAELTSVSPRCEYASHTGWLRLERPFQLAPLREAGATDRQ
jgi:hypothetical protein